jgi:hypothetical protein
MCLRIAYVDLPYTDEESVTIAEDEPAPDAVRDALLRAAIDDQRAHAVCVRTTIGGPTDAAADRLRLGRISMPSGTVLSIAGGHEGWLAGRSSTCRARLRRDLRALKRADGRVLRIADPRPQAARLVELQRATVDVTVGKGGIEVPVLMREAFFDGLWALPSPTRTVVAAEVEGRIVGSLVVLVAPGNLALVGPCGLDYEVAPRSRAYFCLWPEIVALAAEAGCTQVHMGSEAYENKLRLGAVKVETAFRVAYVSRALRLLAAPLTAALGDALGSGEKERGKEDDVE